VGNPAAADDLVQDTLARAWAKLHLYRQGTDLRAWLFTVMHNIYVNDMRAMHPADPVDEESAPEPCAPQTDPLLVRDLERALAKLSIEQRSVLLLICLEGMTYEEAARTLGVEVGTVISRLSRARNKLRALLFGESKLKLVQ
jgi:RNA polymerase sigma-70 factor (ECF subfamily)